MSSTPHHGKPPLVAHVIHRLGIGGLENGLVNLINRTPAGRYRHAVICLTEASSFRERIRNDDVPVVGLGKRAGQDLRVHYNLWRLLRRWRPAIVHTRNLSALECAIPAALAGVPVRLHGEHGRDIYDLDGVNRRYIALRRALRRVVHHYIAVSAELEDWLVSAVRVPRARVTRIRNGVDLDRFRPRIGPRLTAGPPGFAPPGTFVVGTVGRLEPVKDQLTLVRAFLALRSASRDARDQLRLVLIGDGQLREEARRLLRDAGAESVALLAGDRDDVPALMQGLDLFVLPSLREGISNTILEAMATGLPVVATRVGGNVELVTDGLTGALVPPADPTALAAAIQSYVDDPARRVRDGDAARRRAEAELGLDGMVTSYLEVYDALLGRRMTLRHAPAEAGGTPCAA